MTESELKTIILETMRWRRLTRPEARYLLDAITTRADEGGHTPAGFGRDQDEAHQREHDDTDFEAFLHELVICAELDDAECRLLSTILDHPGPAWS
jgi:hypothetical protein